MYLLEIRCGQLNKIFAIVLRIILASNHVESENEVIILEKSDLRCHIEIK